MIRLTVVIDRLNITSINILCNTALSFRQIEVDNLRSSQFTKNLDHVAFAGNLPVILERLTLCINPTIVTSIEGRSGLRLRYEFNNNVLDTSGNNFDGTLNGNPSFTFDQNNNANPAIFLNGSAQFVRFPDTVFGPSVEAFTFYAKVNADPSKSGGIIMKGSTNGEAQLKIFNGEFSFQVNTGSSWEYATTTATAGYKNLVGTYLKNSSISIFVDGDLKKRTPITNSGLWANWGFFTAVS